jgi:hypothetical protein
MSAGTGRLYPNHFAHPLDNSLDHVFVCFDARRWSNMSYHVDTGFVGCTKQHVGWLDQASIEHGRQQLDQWLYVDLGGDLDDEEHGVRGGELFEERDGPWQERIVGIRRIQRGIPD